MTAEPLPHPGDPGTVDADNPWPGLASFREADQELFFGRELETQELLRLVLRERLTVLFGLSGLGKTSVLRAGLFPDLRQENVLPVYVRLDFSEERECTLASQVRQGIVREAEAAGIEAPSFPASETLWESLHRQGAELWSPRNRIVTPLLVFDQFEEVFTLGRRNAARAEEAEAFLAELADLCEGSVPADVRERLEADPSATREFSFTRHPYKILLSLREDFLPELEGLRGRIRSIVQNRFRLRRMNGDNALRVVTQAGGHLVEPDAPDRIVRFVAGRESDSAVPLAGLEIEPALLSVVCRELNNKRRAQGLPRITAGLVSGNRDEILSDLYERSVNDLGPGVRSFIEERLLTKSGFRDTVALENAIELPGVTREALDRLTDRRLLRIEDRGGQQRLELTHDVLTGVIRKSRDRRREQEAGEKAEAERREAEGKLRRSRLVIALLALVLIGVMTLAAWGLAAQRQAREALADSDVGRALNLRESSPAQALAYLARALRLEPESVAAQSLLTDLLLYTTWPRPISELRIADAAWVSLSEHGRFFAAVTESGTVRLWDTGTLRQVGELELPEAAESLDISRDGRRILIHSAGAAQLWDTRTGRSLDRFELGEKSHELLSPDGRWLARAPGDHTLVLRRIDTGMEHRIPFPPYPPDLAPFGGYENFAFSPDSRMVFAHDNLQILLWDVESGRSLPAPPGGRIVGARFSPDSRYLVITGSDTSLWDVAAGRPAGKRFAGEATQAWVSPQGERLAIYDDETLRIWSNDDLKLLAEIPKRDLLRAEFSPDGQLLLTTSEEEEIELWDANTGSLVNPAFCDCLEGRFLADTRQIVTADDSGILRAWSAEPYRTGTQLPAHPMNIGFDQVGRRVAIHGHDRGIQVWDADAVRPVGAPIPRVERFKLSSDGRFLLATRGDVLQLWDTSSSRPVWQPVQLSTDQGTAFDPEKAILALLNRDSTVQLRSLAEGRQIAGIRPGQKIDQFMFPPGGERLVTTFAKGGVRTWDPRTGAMLGRPMEHESRIYSFAFSSDGKRIATGTKKGVVRIWDLQSGALLVGPLSHRYGVGNVQFQRADRLLLTRARNLLRLWDTQAGQPIGGIIRATGNVESAQLSPDGARTLVIARDEPIRLLDSRTGETLVRIPRTPIFLRARFSAGGQLLWIASEERVDVFAVPLFPEEDRELLARWAEAVSGWTLDNEGRLVEIQDQRARLEGLRRETAEAPPGELGAASLIRWFLSDPKTRTSSPVIGATAAGGT